MTYFLEGVFVGMAGGFFVALNVFNYATKRVAKAILEENELCRR